MNSKDVKTLFSAAQIVISIDDLLQEILRRVPIRPLCRFQLVSKHWQSLITSPRFCCRVRRNPAVGLFLSPFDKLQQHCYDYVPLRPAKNSPNRTRNMIINFTPDPYRIQIAHSCNGLLLCWNSWGAHHREARFYVYNPTTNKFSMLPPPENVADIEHMSLVFDPSKCHHYKVVCVKVFDVETLLCQLEVYSSETRGPWVKCGGGPFKALLCFRTGVCWNGAIHWFQFRWYERSRGTGQLMDSLFFDPDNPRHLMLGPQIMPTPRVHNDSHWSCLEYYFGESSGHLHYIHLVWPQIQIVVYEMRTDYSEWFVKYRVEARQLIDAYRINWDNLSPNWWCYQRFSIYTIVRLGEEEEEDDSFLVLQFEGKVTRYNLVSGACETICELEAGSEPYREFHDNGFQHIESMCHV